MVPRPAFSHNSAARFFCQRDLHAWGCSVFFHVALVALAFIQFPILPTHVRPEPFRWDVSLVDPLPTVHVDTAESPTAPAPVSTSVVTPETVANAPRTVSDTMAGDVPTPPLSSQSDATGPQFSALANRTTPVPEPSIADFSDLQTADRVNSTSSASSAEFRIPTAPQSQDLLAATPAPTPGGERDPVQPLTAQSESASDASRIHLARTIQESAPLHDTPSPARYEQAKPLEDRAPAQALAPVAAIDTATAPATVRATAADYGWLQKHLSQRLEELKRLNRPLLRQEGKVRVLVRAVVTNHGELADATVEQSSGESLLDEAALTLVRKAFPMPLERTLDRPQIAMKIPITYSREW